MQGAALTRHSGTLLTVERGMRVLRAFESVRTPLSNTQLAARTTLPKASVSRLTSTLVQLGYLRHVPGGRAFELATGPLAMGHAFVASSELVRIAQPLLQELANRLDISVALGIRDGLDILYIAYRASIYTGTLRLSVGSVLPIAQTAIGHAYLAGLSPEQREPLLALLRGAAGERWSALEREIDASVRQVQRSGTCAVLARYQRGTYAIALPVHVGRQRILMAMSCGKAQANPDLRADRRRIAPELRRAALELERSLADLDGPP